MGVREMVTLPSTSAATRLTRASNSPIPAKNPFRIGRIQRQIKRTFIANPGRPLTTSELIRCAYPRLKVFETWRYEQVRVAAERFAVRIGVAKTRRGKPILWLPNAELMRSILPRQ